MLAHSIEFAKKLSYVDKILLSTDSKAYADIGIKYGAISQWVGDLNAWEEFLIKNENKFDNVIEFIGSPKTFNAVLHIASQMAVVVWEKVTSTMNLKQMISHL